ncbi:MAG: hypothetical protein O7F11_02345 [Acidobacteria bacterium]|nr:hypothetical protein [Acidobacteriota bacterium]MCZ6651392.1 hypothetical protein [Acidobacteriota bacterium]MCZ6832565.1 hypothetical protein [Acidobacteriota bacterium]
MSDEYSVELKLDGDPAMLGVAARLFREMGEVPEGPGEDEIKRLAVVVEPVLAALLESLSQLPGPPSLDLKLGCAAREVTVELSVASAGRKGRKLLGKNAGSLVAGVEKIFDKVVGPKAPAGSAFRFSLTRIIPV